VKLEEMAIDVYRMFKSAIEGKVKIPDCAITFEWFSSLEKGAISIRHDPYFSHLSSHCEKACLNSQWQSCVSFGCLRNRVQQK
jgi:hypothetical protein